MGLLNYGVWKATPTSFTAERKDKDPKSPHGFLNFKDGVSTRPELEAAINAKSISSDSRLVYWLIEDFTHPITDRLKRLPRGWKNIGFNSGSDPERVSLDLLRDGLVEANAGTVVPHDEEGEKNDIIDFMVPFFNNAIDKEATVYIFGEQYRGKDGVHDIHMNQGSAEPFTEQNGTHQDGGVILEFDDGHWKAFFIAFASQTIQTDSNGDPEGETLAVVLGAPPPTGDNTGRTAPAPTGPRTSGQVKITAALVNPEGHDNIDNPEKVYLKNGTSNNIELSGWTIENHMGDSYKLPRSAIATTAGDEDEFEVPGVPLSNKGGSIILKDSEKKVVDEVSYTQEQASRSGELIRFD